MMRLSLLGLVFAAASGMTGTNCNVGPGGGGGGGGGGNNNGTKPTILASDHVLGNPSAALTIVEYADFECPFCGRFARTEFATVKANYIDTGKVRWVFRHFPLRNIHPRAEAAARASECGNDQGDFFTYADLIFNTTDAAGTSVILTDSQLRAHAETMNLDMTTFDACFPPGDGKAARVQQDVNSGTALSVGSTPTFFFNEERSPGFKTAEEMAVIIERKLAGG